MKKQIIAIATIAVLAVGGLSAQDAPRKVSDYHPHHHGHQFNENAKHGPHRMAAPPMQYAANGIEQSIMEAFPKAAKVSAKENWTEVLNANGKLLGYAVYSKPQSDSIYGWNSETPVMIALNKKKVIMGVYLLPNMETPKFEQKVRTSGFYNQWNGLSVKKAKKKVVDTVSGATYTSRAVQQSVQAALSKL